MDFVTIALLCTNLALLSEVLSSMRFRKRVAKLLMLQDKVNKTQLDINAALIGIKEDK